MRRKELFIRCFKYFFSGVFGLIFSIVIYYDIFVFSFSIFALIVGSIFLVVGLLGKSHLFILRDNNIPDPQTLYGILLLIFFGTLMLISVIVRPWSLSNSGASPNLWAVSLFVAIWIWCWVGEKIWLYIREKERRNIEHFY